MHTTLYNKQINYKNVILKLSRYLLHAVEPH